MAANGGTKSASSASGFGKIAKTQLCQGDPQIVKEEIVKGSAPYLQQLQFMTDLETKAALMKAANDAQSKGGNKPTPQVAVMRDAGRLYLNERYRPAMMSGNACQMDEAQMANMVNLQAYRAELVKLSENYKKNGMKVQKECVDTLLTSLDKKQLIQLAELNRIFEVLGNDAEVPRAQAHGMIDDMVRDNMLTPEEGAAIKKQLVTDQVKLEQIAKLTAPYMALRQDGTIGSKNVAAKPASPSKSPSSTPKYRVPKEIGCYQPIGPGNKSPQFSPRALKGQACGPSRPIVQNYVVNYREATVSADLK